jgi:hypothetical protein
MLWNRIPRVCFFFLRNGIPSIFLLCGTVRNGIPKVFFSAEWFRTEFREFASIFVPWYRIPNIFLLCGTVQNGIPIDVPRNSRNSAGTDQLFRLFRLLQNSFLSEIANPSVPNSNYSCRSLVSSFLMAAGVPSKEIVSGILICVPCDPGVIKDSIYAVSLCSQVLHLYSI